MRGRAAGTPDNLRGAAYIEREVRRLGLEPAGENGTYFQDVVLASRAVSPKSALSVDGRTFTLVADIIPRDLGPGMRSIDGATAIYGGTWGDSASLLDPAKAAGKIVVLTLSSGWSVNRYATTGRYKTAAAVVLASADLMSPQTKESLLQPSLDVASAVPAASTPIPNLFYASNALVNAMFGGALPATLKTGAIGKTVRGNITYVTNTPPPGRNVIAVLRGADPAVRGQMVALGAHNDHLPVASPIDHDSLRAYNIVARPAGAESGDTKITDAQRTRIRAILDSLRAIRPPRLDSIMNGADDDGSGSMALLEIAEAFSKPGARPRRSMLFVWHTGEESGLIGSDWFTNHPTVPRDSIVAQLNIDMIGRGGSKDAVHEQNGQPVYGNPDFVDVIGSKRLSTELGNIVVAANQAQRRPLALSYAYDYDGEPHQMYCRSDHYMYARYGIPISFFFTSVHHDYHQVTDEPQYIDYTHYARIVNLIGDIAQRVANLDHRLIVDKPKPDPNARCVA